MRGYKLILENWICQVGEEMPYKDMYGEEEFRWTVLNSQKYAVGETAVVDGRPVLGAWGLHFCTDMADCLDYRELTPEMHMCEVEALGEIAGSCYPGDSTHCANRLKIIREIPFDELMQHIAEYGLLEKDPSLLQYVKQQTEDICLTAVQEDGRALRYVENKTPEICMTAVKQDGLALEYVENQTPEICLAAVSEDWEALQFVKDQTEEICTAAVRQDPRALQYVRDSELKKKLRLSLFS